MVGLCLFVVLFYQLSYRTEKINNRELGKTSLSTLLSEIFKN